MIETWYQDWCIYERERLQLTYLAMLEKLMGYCEARQRYAEGLAYGQDILRYDPARECTHRRLMRLHYKAGDRTGALHQFERCASALAKEFALQPSRETLALCEQIRADRMDDLAHERTWNQAAQLTQAEPPQEFSHLHQRLDQIQACLVSIQNQLQQELVTIRQAAKHGGETLQQTPRQMS